MSLLPDINEIEEDIRKNPEKYVVKKPIRITGAFKRKKENVWISDFEQEKFLNDSEWNDFTINPDAVLSQQDRNRSKYIEFKDRLSKKDFDEIIEVLTLFVERCIPKPFWSIALRGTYNGWMLSCMPGNYGYAGVTAGQHYVANIDLSGDFNIYVSKEDIERQFGSFAKFHTEYSKALTRPFETETGKKHDVLCVTFQIQDAENALNNPKVILTVRSFVSLLMNQSQTIHHKHQCEPLVELVLERIVKPLCPNCHAMAHYGRPCQSSRSIEELKKNIKDEK